MVLPSQGFPLGNISSRPPSRPSFCKSKRCSTTLAPVGMLDAPSAIFLHAARSLCHALKDLVLCPEVILAPPHVALLAESRMNRAAMQQLCFVMSNGIRMQPSCR